MNKKQIIVVSAPFKKGSINFIGTKAFIIQSEEDMNDKVREWFAEVAVNGREPNRELLPVMLPIEETLIKEIIADWEGRT